MEPYEELESPIAQNIRVCILEDQQTARLGTEDILRAAGCWIVGSTGSPEEFVKLVTEYEPQIAIVDIVLGRDRGNTRGLDILARLREVVPQVRCLVYTSFPEPRYFYNSICAGAAGYMVKETPIGRQLTLPEVVAMIADGQSYYDGELVKTMMQYVDETRIPMPYGGIAGEARLHFSPRELDIMRMVYEGRQNKEISRALNMGVETVRKRLQEIYQKTGYHDRMQAANYLARLGYFNSG